MIYNIYVYFLNVVLTVGQRICVGQRGQILVQHGAVFVEVGRHRGLTHLAGALRSGKNQVATGGLGSFAV